MAKKETFLSKIRGDSSISLNEEEMLRKELLDLKNFQIQLVDTAGLKSTLITAQDKMINKHTLYLINQLDIILDKTLYNN